MSPFSNDGKDIFWGGGVEFDLDKNIAWRAGYERFKFDGDDDVDDGDAGADDDGFEMGWHAVPVHILGFYLK